MLRRPPPSAPGDAPFGGPGPSMPCELLPKTYGLEGGRSPPRLYRPGRSAGGLPLPRPRRRRPLAPGIGVAAGDSRWPDEGRSCSKGPSFGRPMSRSRDGYGHRQGIPVIAFKSYHLLSPRGRPKVVIAATAGAGLNPNQGRSDAGLVVRQVMAGHISTGRPHRSR